MHNNKIYRRSHSRLRYGNYDSTEIYRRSHAGYACTYDYTETYREEGRAQKLPLNFLKFRYI